MAGIYLHIPFCKQACHYCDFHFSTSLKYKPEMVMALCRELEQRKDYLPENSTIDTIYFGGGTPSLLDDTELQQIFEAISKNYNLSQKPEITLEANPDDLTKGKLKSLRQTPVNRLSIGIQSFFEEDLRWMNRAHSSEEAKIVLQNSLDAGFENLTADLIFGYPLLTDEKWLFNLNYLIQTGIQHLSAYCMTVEKGTPLWTFIQRDRQKPMAEEQGARQFLMAMDELQRAGWEQYEISNYAKNGHYSRHNTGYWRGIPYLGIGPSAHSFDGNSRQWNTKVNYRYMQDVAKNKPVFQKEILTRNDQINEYIMTSLRTIWGIRSQAFTERFGNRKYQQILQKCLVFQQQNDVQVTKEKIILTRDGKLFADHIAAALFV